MKEKGDPCILVGYSTQSKGYRVYNKRTRLIVESIHLRFDEIKEMSETSVANDTSGLVPQRQKASDYDNPDPAPELQNVSPSADTTVPSQQETDNTNQCITLRKTMDNQQIYQSISVHRYKIMLSLPHAYWLVQDLPCLQTTLHPLLPIRSYLPIQTDQQGQTHPLSPAYVPDPMELDEHVPLYAPEPEHPEHHIPSDDDSQAEDQPYAEDASPTTESPGYIADSDPMEDDTNADSIDCPDEPGTDDEDEDPEEDPSEEHGPENEDAKEDESSEDSNETEPFEENKTAATPPPPKSP
ncbi:hypothetical protein Tco_0471575 [Tanacetum coccineum]